MAYMECLATEGHLTIPSTRLTPIVILLRPGAIGRYERGSWPRWCERPFWCRSPCVRCASVGLVFSPVDSTDFGMVNSKANDPNQLDLPVYLIPIIWQLLSLTLLHPGARGARTPRARKTAPVFPPPSSAASLQFVAPFRPRSSLAFHRWGTAAPLEVSLVQPRATSATPNLIFCASSAFSSSACGAKSIAHNHARTTQPSAHSQNHLETALSAQI